MREVLPARLVFRHNPNWLYRPFRGPISSILVHTALEVAIAIGRFGYYLKELHDLQYL